jgi:hypothetical protein
VVVCGDNRNLTLGIGQLINDVSRVSNLDFFSNRQLKKVAIGDDIAVAISGMYQSAVYRLLFRH